MRMLPEILTSYLASVYGGKRAFLVAMWYGAHARTGAFRRYRRIRWAEVSRIVFVCAGNICRSPYAERRFRALGGNAASAGLLADPGKPAALAAQRAALQRGIDLADHQCRAVSDLDLVAGDLLIAFEPKHARALSTLVGERSDVQVSLLGLWSSTPWLVHLQDPYGLPAEYFQECFERIDRALEGILAHVSLRKAGH
jgi:protein-tyrosine phosphatase